MKRMTFYLGMALAVLSLASCRNGGEEYHYSGVKRTPV